MGLFYARNHLQHTSTHEFSTAVARRWNISHLGRGCFMAMRGLSSRRGWSLKGRLGGTLVLTGQMLSWFVQRWRMTEGQASSRKLADRLHVVLMGRRWCLWWLVQLKGLVLVGGLQWMRVLEVAVSAIWRMSVLQPLLLSCSSFFLSSSCYSPSSLRLPSETLPSQLRASAAWFPPPAEPYKERCWSSYLDKWSGMD